jgi:Ca-activated chloride channel family protein
MIDFAWPWAFLALPLPWLVRRFLPATAEGAHGGLRVPFFAQLAPGADIGHRPPAWVGWLAGAAWIALVIAAAQPQRWGETVEQPLAGRDLLIAIDLSRTMDRADFERDGEPVTRLEVVKQVAKRFIDGRTGDRVGLILFGQQAYLQSPLTFDRASVQALLERAEIGLAGRQTAIGDAIGLALKRLEATAAGRAAEAPSGSPPVLILMTDGQNNAGHVPPREAARLAAERGLRIYPIGVGSARTGLRGPFGYTRQDAQGALDEESLIGIAETTGGRYFRARDLEDLRRIYARLDTLEPTQAPADPYRPRTPLYPWPLALGLGLSVLLIWRDPRTG